MKTSAPAKRKVACFEVGVGNGSHPKASEDESFRVGVLSTQVGEVLARTWPKVIAWVAGEREPQDSP